jgi:hypothetical protein
MGFRRGQRQGSQEKKPERSRAERTAEFSLSCQGLELRQKINMQTQYSSAIDDSTTLIPLTLDERRQSSFPTPISDPLSFIEAIRDLHTQPDGAVVFARKNKRSDTIGPSGFEAIGGCTVAELRPQDQSIFALLRVDGFMTINAVYVGNRITRESRLNPSLRQYRRRIEDLRWLNAAFVDIDSLKLGSEPEQALKVAIDLLIVQGLPLPTHISMSGAGVWLFWRFLESVRAWPEKCALLKRMDQQLVRIFKHLGADPNSVDAARITRCAGTINSKNGKTVKFFRVEASSKFSFDELVRVFQVPAQKTPLPGERKSVGPKNPNRVQAGKLRYGRRLSGFLKLGGIRGFFPTWTRRQAIFGLAVLLFKNGVPKKQILEQCTKFALQSCKPAITDKADIERRVRAAFRYKAYISDAKFAEWFSITEKEKLLLPEWFRPKLPPKEPAKVRIARRRVLIRTLLQQFGCGLSHYKLAQLVAGALQDSHGIKVTSMTIQRDLAAIAKEDATKTNISLLESTSSPLHLSNRNVCTKRVA